MSSQSSVLVQTTPICLCGCIHLSQASHSLIHSLTVPDLPVCVCFDTDRGMLLDETPLFDPALLQDLDWSSNTISFSPPISPANPGDGLVLRPLCIADFKRGESQQGPSVTYGMKVLVAEFCLIFFFFCFSQDFTVFYLSLQKQAMSQQSSSQVGQRFFSPFFFLT